MKCKQAIRWHSLMGKDFEQIQRIFQDGNRRRVSISKKKSMPKLIKKKWNRNHINLMKKNEEKQWLKVNYSVNQANQQSPKHKDLNRIFKKDKFNCPICFSSVVEPVITICGHLYCYKCINDVFSQDKRCSYCNTILYPNLIRRSMISQEVICQVYLSTLSISDKSQSKNRKSPHLWKHAQLKDLKECGLIDFYQTVRDDWRSGIVIKIKKESEDAFSVILLDLQSLKLVEKSFHPFDFAECLLQRGKISNCIDPFAFLAANTKDRIMTSKIEKYWQNIQEFKIKRYQLAGPSLYALYLAINLKRRQLIADLDLFRFYRTGENDSSMQDEDKIQVLQEVRNSSSYQLMQRLHKLQDANDRKIRQQIDQKANIQTLQNQMLELSLQENNRRAQIQAKQMHNQVRTEVETMVPEEKSRFNFDIDSLIDGFLYQDSNLLLSQLIYL